MASWTQARILIAAVLLHFPLAGGKILGNLTTYMYSLYYSRDHSNIGGMGPPWMYGIFIVSVSLTLMLSDIIKNKIGLRLLCALGVGLYSMAYFLTYFTVQWSAWTTNITLNAMGGAGDGLISAVCLIYLVSWFDEKLGLANSVAESANGLAGIAVNPVITAYINPNNVNPDVIRDEMSFFTQPQILSRIPMVFVVIGAIQSSFHLVGFCLLKTPPSSNLDSCQNQSEERTKKNGHFSQKANSLSYTTENEPDHLNEYGATQHRPYFVEDTKRSGLQTGGADSVVKQTDKTPRQVLKSETFYLVWLVSVSQAFGLGVIATYFKAFGQIWISDDQFLATVGSCLALVPVFWQVAVGHFIDKFGLKNTIIFHLAAETLLSATWYFTPEFNRWIYFVWTVALYCQLNDQYLLLSTAAVYLFGETYCATNFGLLLSGTIVGTLGGSPLMTYVLSTYGWFHLFFFAGALSFVVLVLIVIRLTNEQNSRKAH